MISVIPSARKPASSGRLLLAAALLLAGCARDPIDEAAWQASRVGTAAGDHPKKTPLTGIEAGSRIAEHYYFVAKYEATLEQRRLAEAAGRRVQAGMRAGPVRPVQPRGSSRYLAVRTRSDKRAKTPVSVMIWDTQAQEIVGNNVYDLNGPPPAGAALRFQTFAAEYVGAGN